jgi:photosystem II stability/assembly factor-like uncharacterized protein
MDKDQQPFTAESVDDEIDRLTNTNSFTSSDTNVQLLHGLRHVYTQDADSLKQVWERLERYSIQQQVSQVSHEETTQRKAASYYILPTQKNSHSAKYPTSQPFTVLVASIIGALLVGSLAWVLTVTHAPTRLTSSSASAKPTAQAATQPNVQPKPMIAIRMLDNINGWALTSSSILKTSDGGIHWSDVTPKDQTPGINAQCEFLTMQTAWVAWQSTKGSLGQTQSITILHTSNGGASWQTATITHATGHLADPPRFINTQQGWLVITDSQGTARGIINTYQTTDGGQTWTNISGQVDTSAASGVSVSNAQLGWVGLHWPGNQPTVEKTIDGGRNWQQQSLSLPGGVSSDGDIVTDAPVLIGADGLLPTHINMTDSNHSVQTKLAVYTTHDSGNTWTAGTLANFDSTDVYALDAQHVWAEETNRNALHFSSDGGKTWVQLAQTPHHFGALSFVDTYNGWAIDDAGQLYQTTDGGTNWQSINSSIS